MATATKTAITPTRSEDYPQWYQEVIKAADLAETSPVRGCMVIKPWGYGLWENIQKNLDGRFKATGHKNAYFPLFIPLSFLQREADHVEGFAKECAVVTHHRLEPDSDGKLKPAGELEEPLIVRPTSETIIGEMFSKWIESYRDLPLLINQWANVVRWEMRTRLFLRTAEFLWQEGHTAHATEQEAIDETLQMLDIYKDFAENTMAMPVITGAKSEGERFPGAVETYSIEAMMQDGKALQSGTSHFLGQNFSKAQDISFQNDNKEVEFAWTTSWGVSTRLIGGLIMSHADDDGLVLPPRLAPSHIVIIPITFKADDPEAILNYCHKLADDLGVINYHGRSVEVEIDNRDIRGGEKTWGWVKKGIPIRLEVGPRDMKSDSVFMARRDKGHKEKCGVPRVEFIETVTDILDEMQQGLFDRALARREEATKIIDSKDDFYNHFDGDGNGFVYAHFCGDPAVEDEIKGDLKVTLRCIPLHGHNEEGTCIFTGKPSKQRVLWAKSY
ncbi:MAG: proline--tRNA ligase [Planctomycetes bacterium]|nr:proline--tRNA ligase [Planctomycetota bacterium]MBL6997020.1 proline--tRNA ligase [Phycisphaerales bacterium]